MSDHIFEKALRRVVDTREFSRKQSGQRPRINFAKDQGRETLCVTKNKEALTDLKSFSREGRFVFEDTIGRQSE
jgi:hypothetical protein